MILNSYFSIYKKKNEFHGILHGRFYRINIPAMVYTLHKCVSINENKLTTTD